MFMQKKICRNNIKYIGRKMVLKIKEVDLFELKFMIITRP